MVDEDDRARGLIELKSLFSADATPSHGDPSACIRGISNDIATRAEVRKRDPMSAPGRSWPSCTPSNTTSSCEVVLERCAPTAS
jgi:hypothetical protein